KGIESKFRFFSTSVHNEAMALIIHCQTIDRARKSNMIWYAKAKDFIHQTNVETKFRRETIADIMFARAIIWFIFKTIATTRIGCIAKVKNANKFVFKKFSNQCDIGIHVNDLCFRVITPHITSIPQTTVI